MDREPENDDEGVVRDSQLRPVQDWKLFTDRLEVVNYFRVYGPEDLPGARATAPDPSGGQMVPDALVADGGFCPPPLIDYSRLPPAPPRPRRHRLRTWARFHAVGVREWVALKIAPWLERDPWD